MPEVNLFKDIAWINNIWTNEEQTHPRPIVYYTNPGYPEDLEKITAQIANDWDAPFTKAVQLKAGLTEEEIRETLRQDAQDQGVQSWMFLENDQLGAQGMFQIRRNTCSPQGIDHYLSQFDDNQKVQKISNC